MPNFAIIITYSITWPRCSALPEARPVFNSIGIILHLPSYFVNTDTSTLPLTPNSGTHKFSSISSTDSISPCQVFLSCPLIEETKYIICFYFSYFVYLNIYK